MNLSDSRQGYFSLAIDFSGEDFHRLLYLADDAVN
jgi:hypothetical protein